MRTLHPLASVATLLVIFLGIFTWFPTLDPWVTSLFYEPGSHSFPANNNQILSLVVMYGPTLLVSVLILIAVRQWRLGHVVMSIYLVLCCVLGSWITVETVMKKFIERPRPHEIHQFGGTYSYQNLYKTRDLQLGMSKPKQCRSFPSGHASTGYLFYSIALTCTGKRRRRLMLLGTSMGLLMGAVRIAQGGHFLSDILFTGLFVYVVCYALNVLREKWNNTQKQRQA